MYSDNVYLPIGPGESASRTLDRMVQFQEMPYGYDGGEPPADHQNSEMEQDYVPRGKKHR